MADALAPVRKDFLGRLETARWLGWVAFSLDRTGLAWALALAPGVVLVAAAALAPPAVGEAVTSPQNVHTLFARFVTAVATASSIAVSVATFTMRREVRGIRSLREHYEANLEFRDRVRDARGGTRYYVPISIAAFLPYVLETVEDAARRTREAASIHELDGRVEGVRLGDFLDALSSSAASARRGVARSGSHPAVMLRAVLDFEVAVSDHLARRFAAESDSGSDLERALHDLCRGMGNLVVAVDYVKTLTTQWGLSRMSVSVLAATIPSIAVASGMVLAYGEGARAAWGVLGASALVGGALAVTLLPITMFVSHLLRFVFTNEHTLPTIGFVLGPEEPDVPRSELGRRA